MAEQKNDLESSIHSLHEKMVARRKWTFSRIKTSFLTGVLVTVPIFLTVWVVWFAFDKLTSWSIGFVDTITPEHDLDSTEKMLIRVCALVFIAFVLFFVGVLTKVTLGEKLIQFLQWILSKIPVVNFLYGTVKQVADTLFKPKPGGANNQQVVLCEYPRKGIYSIGLLTNENREDNELQRKTGKELVSVFVPTTPNPTSGYLLYIPREDVILLDMDAAAAMRLIISCGALPINGEKAEENGNPSEKK